MLKLGRLEGGRPRLCLGDDSVVAVVAVAMAVTVSVSVAGVSVAGVSVAGVAVALLGRLV